MQDQASKSRFRTLMLGAVLAFVTVPVACGQPEPAEEPREVSAAELQEFRNEVTAALQSIQFELQAMQDRIARADPDDWEELRTTAQRTENEVLTELDRLATATAEEAREVRKAATERLAELEAEVARSEVETSENREELRETTENKIVSLEANLAQLRNQIHMPPMEPVDPEAQLPPPSPVSREEIGELEDRLAELRIDLRELATASEEDIADYREQFGDEVAELTREVRTVWYSVRWNVTA
jgi:DNA repair exonuclease SbcCD ATPase subunit